ncbi:hypothetical protein [Caulobacter sp. S45]|jgi:hypothetical protein|nr:hypothetical protein [Caulobacter sp. S45]
MAIDRLRRRAQRPAIYAAVAALSTVLCVVGVAGLLRLAAG